MNAAHVHTNESNNIQQISSSLGPVSRREMCVVWLRALLLMSMDLNHNKKKRNKQLMWLREGIRKQPKHIFSSYRLFHLFICYIIKHSQTLNMTYLSYLYMHFEKV